MNRKAYMTKRVAERWIKEVSFPEYHVQVLTSTSGGMNVYHFLCSVRNGSMKLGDRQLQEEYNLQETNEGVEVWSKNYEDMLHITHFFEKRGYETTGLW